MTASPSSPQSFLRSLLPTLAFATCALGGGPVFTLAPAPAPSPGDTGGVALETWNFDETTTGADILWTSPTSVDPAAVAYDSTVEITAVEVTVEFLSIPFGPISVIDSVPPEDLVSTGNFAGPAPIDVLDIPIDVPGAPEPTAVAGTISFGLDAAGSGFFSFTDVVLGTADVDLGFPLGVVTADITSLRVAGTVMIDETQWLDLGNGLAGTGSVTPRLSGAGDLLGNDLVTITLEDALPLSSAFFILGAANISAPFKQGILVPSVNVLLPNLPVDALGGIEFSFTWPAGIVGGVTLYYQYWIVDAGGPVGFAASNGLSSTTP